MYPQGGSAKPTQMGYNVSMPDVSGKTPLFQIRAVVLAVAIFSILFFLIDTHPLFAQDAFEQLGEASTLPTENIAIIIARVIRAALTVVGIIFTSLIIYAGFLYLLSKGDPEPVKKAKRILQQSIIGLIIIFSAYSITTFILNRLLEAAVSGTSRAIAEAYGEPLSGALGGGIIDDHYPERNATDIPRNTRIFVSFKEAIDSSTIATGCEQDSGSTDLNIDSVLIYPTEEGPGAVLGADEVAVTCNGDFTIFNFDPVDYLGSAEEDTNYTVALTTSIEKADGSDAFSGTYADGYSWTFEVSTEIDLTPPYVVSVVPAPDASEPRNVTIEINFSEAMDPVASTGSYIEGGDDLFTNIEVFDASGTPVQGTFEISNAYRTVSFTTTDACGEDPCGDTIYCLPMNQSIETVAKAATLNEEEVPQAEPTDATFDGLVDAASNSLDGDQDGDVCGSTLDSIVCADGGDDDNYEWSFTTTNDIEDTVPLITSLDPEIKEDEISQSDDLEITFNTLLKSSTVNTQSVSLWPDPYYEFWFAIRKQNDDTTKQTTVLIEHPTLVSTDEGRWEYWPVLTQDIKSAYQICMYPAVGPGSTCEEGRDDDQPYCCNGLASASECQTDTQKDDAVGETLPDNTETEL